MTALAMAVFPNVDKVSQAKDQRNAQGLCSVCIAAEAAGVPVIRDGLSKIEVLRLLRNGVLVEQGLFKGRTFAVPNINEEDLNRAGRYLELSGGQMIYQPRGVPDSP